MTKNQEIDVLFQTINRKIPETLNRIKKDGIIDEEIFGQQTKKILFICKEANDPKQNAGDFRTWWKEELWGIHANRVGTWAHGILENFPDLTSITTEDKMEALGRIAFINLKKIGGNSKSNLPEIVNHLRITKIELLRQIEIINPDLIIGGVTWNILWEELFPSIELVRIDEDVLKWKDKHIIHFFHPSARKSNQFLYEELERKINKAYNYG